MKVFAIYSLFVFLCCLEVALSYPRPATTPDGVGRPQSRQSTYGKFAHAAYENLGVYCQSFTWFLFMLSCFCLQMYSVTGVVIALDTFYSWQGPVMTAVGMEANPMIQATITASHAKIENGF